MTRNILIAVLRNDLRLHDHPVLYYCADPTPAGAKFARPITHVLPVYVWDQRQVEVGGFPGLVKAGKGNKLAKTRELGLWRCGVHRTKFVNNSVFDLRDRLRARGSDLAMYAGTPEAVIPKLVRAIRNKGDTVEGVWMGKEVNTEEVNVEKRLRSLLSDLQCSFRLEEGKSLIHPADLGFPIKKLPDVYTQFRKQVEGPEMYRLPVDAPCKFKPFPELEALSVSDEAGVYSISTKKSEGFDRREVVESILLGPLRDSPMLGHELLKKGEKGTPTNAFPFKGGETEALDRLEHYFLGGQNAPAAKYKETRNGMLGVDYSTKFAAALAHGLLSPRLLASKADELDYGNGVRSGGGYWVVFEILWRDYFYFVGAKFGSRLFTLGGIEEVLNGKAAETKSYDWKEANSLTDSKDGFVRWATGRTGVPLIDANMRELVQTGFMSNRGRQNVASFLTKDLGYNWQHGAEFFEAYLSDYDANSNYGNWQYVAGVGNDPRSSRQFNPIKQGKDYDPDGEYVKTWIPELRDVPASHAHHPWTLGGNVDLHGYPARPMIEQQMWKKHYSARSGGGGGGGGGGRGRSRGRGRGAHGGDGGSRGGGRGGH